MPGRALTSALASMEYLPFSKTRSVFEMWTDFFRDVSKVDFALEFGQYGLHDCFVFNWVERASRVHESTSHSQHFNAPSENINL
jgi:hypothetical protein